MEGKISVRKIVVLMLVILLCMGAAALVAWKIVDDGGDERANLAASEEDSFKSDLERTTAGDGEEAAPGDGSQEEAGSSGYQSGAADGSSGEDFSYTDPDQRYVSETQRHQNFYKALAEGQVTRLDVTATDYRPVGDPNTSYVYFTITTTGGQSSGTMVMKFEGGLWRIAAVNQLSGDLGGGTNYLVPSSFEDDLGREIQELQPFLTKMAEGRLDYMAIDSAAHPGECETVLNGRVVGTSGRTEQSVMRLRKDYSIWHITEILCL